MKLIAQIALPVVAVIGAIICYAIFIRSSQSTTELRVFYAAGLTRFMDIAARPIAEKNSISLLAEGDGSVVCCRKLTELGRPCDLLLLADAALVTSMLRNHASFRVDFATDEVVLGVGNRAKYVEQAEKDWRNVLLKDDVSAGRVNENLAPIGYRTLLVWKLAELTAQRPLYDALQAQCPIKADDVARVTPLLKRGELDYAFLYKSTCVSENIRYIALDTAINLSSTTTDYSVAEVQFKKLKAGKEEIVTVKGEPVYWTLTVPDASPNRDAAVSFVKRMLIEGSSQLEVCGFRRFKPRLHCAENSWAKTAFADIAEYAGTLTK